MVPLKSSVAVPPMASGFGVALTSRLPSASAAGAYTARSESAAIATSQTRRPHLRSRMWPPSRLAFTLTDGSRVGQRAKAHLRESSWNGAAKESNLPTVGLPRPAGFEDRMGHQTPAAPRLILRSQQLVERLRDVAHLEAAVEVVRLRAVVRRLERERVAAALAGPPLCLLEQRAADAVPARVLGHDQVGDPGLFGFVVQPCAEVQRAERHHARVVLGYEVVAVGIDDLVVPDRVAVGLAVGPHRRTAELLEQARDGAEVIAARRPDPHVPGSPCSSAPFTEASSAFSRWSASASGDANRRSPWCAATQCWSASGASVSMRSPSSTWPSRRPSSLSSISAASRNSRVLPMSCRIAAAISRSEFSRGCRMQVSCASVATATVCSSRPPRYAWWPPRVHGAVRNASRNASSDMNPWTTRASSGSWTSRARCSRKPSSSSISR